MKLHWHLIYENRTACGIVAFETADGVSPTGITEFDRVSGSRIDCANDPAKVTCKMCRLGLRTILPNPHIHKWEAGDRWGVIVGVSRCTDCGKLATVNDFTVKDI